MRLARRLLNGRQEARMTERHARTLFMLLRRMLFELDISERASVRPRGTGV